MAGQQHVRGGRGGERRAASTLRETGAAEGFWCLWMKICFGEVSIVLLRLQRPPHREGWDASSSALYQAWWIRLNRILRSCPDLHGWVQQRLYPFTAKQKPGP